MRCGFSVACLLCWASHATAIQFDLGNGAIDANTGVAANFVIAENSPLSMASQTIDDVTLTLTPVVATGADFSQSLWGSNSQGVGVRSFDAASSPSVDSGSSDTQRRRIAGSVGEAIHFSFDRNVTLDTLRLGSLAPSGSGEAELVEISYVSGLDPFGGAGPFVLSSDTVDSTPPTDDLPVGFDISAGTVLSLSTNADNTFGNGILLNEIAVTLGPDSPPPLALRVFTDTGEVRLVNDSGLPVAIDYYKITSPDAEQDGGSLDDAFWTGLGGAAGFPAGSGAGDGWEPSDNNDAQTIVESFLLGDSTIASGGPAISLGAAFQPNATQDLGFTYHVAGTGLVEVTGTVEYVTSDADLIGDFNGDGLVGPADYAVWRDNLGAPDESALNGNGDGLNGVDPRDYTLWAAQFGAAAPSAVTVPEPSASVFTLTITALGVAIGGRARASRLGRPDKHVSNP